jgi:hypothetical protein
MRLVIWKLDRDEIWPIFTRLIAKLEQPGIVLDQFGNLKDNSDVLYLPPPSPPAPPPLTRMQMLKKWIEAKTGLPLGDAVNVALFGLTVVSLLLAGAGVIVAYVTLKEARDSGKDQKAVLDASRNALESSVKSLSGLQSQISQIASRKPEPSVYVVCGPTGGNAGFLLIPDAKGFTSGLLEVHNVHTDFRRRMSCQFRLNNYGSGPLEGGFLGVTFGGCHGLEASGGPTDVQFRKSTNAQWQNAEKPIHLIDDMFVSPAPGERLETAKFIDLLIGKDCKHLVLSYRYGGRNYQEQSNIVYMNIFVDDDYSKP